MFPPIDLQVLLPDFYTWVGCFELCACPVRANLCTFEFWRHKKYQNKNKNRRAKFNFEVSVLFHQKKGFFLLLLHLCML